MKHLVFVILLISLWVAALGCAGAGEPAAEGDRAYPQDAMSDSSGEASSDSEQSSSSDYDDSDDDVDYGNSGQAGAEDSDIVSRENPGLTGTAFDSGRNDSLFDAQPLDAVTWTMEPTISAGALEAKGVLKDGAALFDPTIGGEGAGFIVYFKGMREPLVLLLPDLGPTRIWETDHTVAPMEQELNGASFAIRAYSPLFMDVGGSDLEIRLFGYDAQRADALLAIQPVTVP